MCKHWKTKWIIWAVTIGCIFGWSLIGCSMSCIAAEQNPRVIRVALPELEGETVRDINGNLSGYTYEYLERIAQFNGWTYEYITFEDLDINDSIVKAMEMVENGEADILGTMLKSPQLTEIYDFPKRNYGVVNTILSILESNTEITDVNFMLCSPLRVAVMETAETRNKEVKEFLDNAGVNYELIFCKNRDTQYACLMEGKADAMLDVSLRSMPGTKQIVKFAPRPYYFVTTKGNEELAQKIDESIEKINYSFPYFEKQLFDKYFGDIIGEFVVTDEEKEYIERKKELNVLCIEDSAPFVFVNPKQEVSGIAVSIFNKFAELTDFSVNYHIYDSNMNIDIKSILSSQKYDCILGIPVNASFKSKFGLVSTNSYLKVPTVIFSNKKSLTKPPEESSVALIKGSDLVDVVISKEFLYYNNIQECIEAVALGDADCGYGNSRSVDYYMEESFADLSVVPLVGNEQNIELSIPNNAEKYLLSLLNRYIQNIDENDLYIYAIEANAYIQKDELESYVRANPIKTVLTLAVFLFSVFATVVLFFVVQSGKKRNQDLKIANAAKTDFFSRVSHDMRTPMNAVVGFSEMALTEEQEKSTLVDYMQKINASGKYLLRLIDDILDMAKIENKKMVLHLEPTDMQVLVEGVVSIMQSQMDTKNIQFTVEVKGFEENQSSIVDKMHLQQISINLLNNAAKFTHDNGNIKWIVENMKSTGNSSYHRITVRDDGIGIEEELLNRLFIPFEQGSDSYIQKGIGLGLAIVKSLVELMKGEIHIRSEVGVGTEIVVEFSALIVETDAALVKLGEQQKNIPIKREFLSGKKILLCEDHPINTHLATKLLEKKGMRVFHADNGKKAVDMFENSMEEYYDAILMDIRMPVLDGLEATQQIRQLSRSDAKSIPIIAMTANIFEEDVKKCHDAGMNEHLAKPIDAQRLFQTLQKLLSK